MYFLILLLAVFLFLVNSLHISSTLVLREITLTLFEVVGLESLKQKQTDFLTQAVKMLIHLVSCE